MKKLTLQKSPRPKWPKFLLIGLFLAFMLLALILWSGNSSSSVFEFAFSKNKVESTDQRVNILLLGNAGGRHDGSSLTDSIIVASYHLKTQNVLLISIPRDLWVQDAMVKVNTLYQVGKKQGDGLKFAADNISKILDLPIHYSIRVDFRGFSEAVDSVGGLDVDVPTTFDDYLYPIEGKENDLCDYKEEEVELTEDQIKSLNLPSPWPADHFLGSSALIPGKRKVLVDKEGKIATDSATLKFTCRYEHIHFDKGITHMDGTTTLKFVRSRMGTSREGSDFARSRRQQLVLQAFRNKVLSLETLVNPQRITSLIATLGDSVETDIPLNKIVEFYKLSKKVNQIESVVLGDMGEGKSLFINPLPSDYGGAWVLIPLQNDFTPIKQYIEQKLKDQESM